MIHPEPHPLAGKTVTLNETTKDPVRGMVAPGMEFEIEDYWDRVAGKSWMFSNGNPAALQFAMRTGTGGVLPVDDEVVYGKIRDGQFGFGHLVHVSELGEVVKDGADEATFTPPSGT